MRNELLFFLPRCLSYLYYGVLKRLSLEGELILISCGRLSKTGTKQRDPVLTNFLLDARKHFVARLLLAEVKPLQSWSGARSGRIDVGM
jgi:hypothetical protein